MTTQLNATNRHEAITLDITPISQIDILLRATHPGRKFVRSSRSVLNILSYAHVGGAILSGCLIFTVRRSDTGAWAVVVAAILLAMVLTRVAQWQLDAGFASTEIVTTKGAGNGSSHAYWDRAIAMAVLAAAALALIGSLISSRIWKDAFGPLWPAAVAMIAAETIYLSWLFESLAIKDELYAIALALSQGSLAALDERKQALEERARLLTERLVCFGFRIVPDQP